MTREPASLKLPKLPDRKPVKLTISLSPQLHAALRDYAAIYQREYGDEESLEALAPYILETFLNSDAGFKRARRKLHQSQPTEKE